MAALCSVGPSGPGTLDAVGTNHTTTSRHFGHRPEQGALGKEGRPSLDWQLRSGQRYTKHRVDSRGVLRVSTAGWWGDWRRHKSFLHLRRTLTPGGTTKNVCRHCRMSVGGKTTPRGRPEEPEGVQAFSAPRCEDHRNRFVFQVVFKTRADFCR